MADWSTPEFNNRNLFSDYFLQSRLTQPGAFAEWNTDLRPGLKQLQQIGDGDGGATLSTPVDYRKQFLDGLLRALGFDPQPVSDQGEGQADYVLHEPGTKKPLAGLLAYRWDRPLDRPDDTPEAPRADDIPAIRVVNVLEQQKLPWTIVTNGKIWRLYCATAHSRATNYYEIDLPVALEQVAQGDVAAFRYFYLFFRAAAFAVPSAPAPTPCFLDRVRLGSAAYAKELGERLREHIFATVFPYLAQGFVDYRKNELEETTKADDPFLAEVYDATLVLLYRLRFLLYAESLDLLPVGEPAYRGISLQALKEEIAAAAGSAPDAVEQHLKDKYNRSDTGLFRRLAKLFAALADGSKEHNVPTYNGGLFTAAFDKADTIREAKAARFLAKFRVPDFYLARALDLLARGEDAKSHDLVFVDYKSLGVRHLGSVYEGLLMYHVVLPREDGEKAYQQPGLKIALVPSNNERKSTGSYFTPQHSVEHIVHHTVGPLLEEKFVALAPKFHAAQRKYADSLTFEKKKPDHVLSRRRSDEQVARDILREYEHVVHDLFDLKVLDPAMGSAHFRVETVDYVTDKVLTFLAGFPWNPVHGFIERRVRRPILDALDEQGIKVNENRLTDVNLIKRLVMKRCVYGVDLNPMAVELAKVSLWLDSFTIGAPLTFLDHHLRCGNSFIGSTIETLKALVPIQA